MRFDCAAAQIRFAIICFSGSAEVAAGLSNENEELKKAVEESRAIRHLIEKKFSDTLVIAQ